jgi:predicted Zn-dependent protease
MDYNVNYWRYLVLLPIAMGVTYKFFMTKRNPFSQQIELRLFSTNFERNYVGKHITNKFEKEFEGRIYKADAPEVERVKRVIEQLVSKNKVQNFLPKIKVRVVHLPKISLGMSLDGTLFVSVKTLNMAESDDELAIILSHEISHYLLDHLPSKIIHLITNSIIEKEQKNLVESAHRESYKKTVKYDSLT